MRDLHVRIYDVLLATHGDGMAIEPLSDIAVRIMEQINMSWTGPKAQSSKEGTQETTERAKFTPGPWKAVGTKVFGLENIIATNQDHPRHYIATVPRATGCHPPGNPDQEANARLIASAPDLAAFKAYVHKRLDDAGVPTDPESPHKAEDCRIGGRLDVVLARYAVVPEMLEALRTAEEALKCYSGGLVAEYAVKQIRAAIAKVEHHGNRGEFAARVLLAFLELNDEVRKIVIEMLEIVAADDADDDERDAAALTLQEALFP